MLDRRSFLRGATALVAVAAVPGVAGARATVGGEFRAWGALLSGEVGYYESVRFVVMSHAAVLNDRWWDNFVNIAEYGGSDDR